MDKNEKFLRIKSLLTEKKVQEDVFSLKINKISEEIYAKQINPLLIKFLNFTSSSVEKLEKAIKIAGGKFKNHLHHHPTRDQLEKAGKYLEKHNFHDFFDILGAEYIEKSEIDNLYEFLDQIEEIVKDLEFARKHSYLGSNLEQISFKKYLNVIYDDRIDILKKPLDHLKYLKIHGIWEVNGTNPPLNEPSYLLAHCTKTHTSCWPIISEGLKISKAKGGRCGSGIYFSNDISKCLQYTSFTKLEEKLSFSLLFFAQVYTGKIHKIYRDDGSLTRSKNYDSVLAMGQVSPKIDIDIWHSDGTSSKIYVDDPDITGVNSSFCNNEFVIYDENRSRLKYIMLISKTGYQT